MKIRIISGEFKGRFIKAPNSLTTRPTSSKLREAFFNICQSNISGADFLDLFAGSGAVGIEAISRNAALSIFVEKNRQAIACIKENIASLGIQDRTKVLPMDSFQALDLLFGKQEKFDLIYCDPPYSLSLELLDKIIFKSLKLLKENGSLYLEFGQDLKNLSIKPNSIKKFSDSYLLEYS